MNGAASVAGGVTGASVSSARAPWRGIITEYRDRLPVTAVGCIPT